MASFHDSTVEEYYSAVKGGLPRYAVSERLGAIRDLCGILGAFEGVEETGNIQGLAERCREWHALSYKLYQRKLIGEHELASVSNYSLRVGEGELNYIDSAIGCICGQMERLADKNVLYEMKEILSH